RRRNAARGFEWRRFDRPFDPYAPSSAIVQKIDQLVRMVRRVDDEIAKSGARERLDLPDDQRLAADTKEGFRRLIGERAHPLAAPGGKDHGSEHGRSICPRRCIRRSTSASRAG